MHALQLSYAMQYYTYLVGENVPTYEYPGNARKQEKKILLGRSLEMECRRGKADI